MVKSEGKDNDLISRVRANAYFAPIHDQLDGANINFFQHSHIPSNTSNFFNSSQP